MFLGDQFVSAVPSNLQHLLPHLCSQLMVVFPISLRKQKRFSQYPHPTTTSLCPYTLPLGPILSDLLKDVASASVPFLLQYHRGFLLYWRSLIIDNHVVIFPFEKKKPSWLYCISFISFPWQRNLRTVCSHCLQFLSSYSPWSPRWSGSLHHHSTKTFQVTNDST